MAIAGLYECFNHWHKQGTVWLYSDTHFGDKDLPNRPTDEEQIKMINSKVGKKDTLILLGDVGDIECAKKLKGYKILICGNHDAGHTVYKEVFNEVYSGPLMIGEKLILSHEPLGCTWAYNIHGHVHQGAKKGTYSFNCCAEAINYIPVNFNQWMKQGYLSKVESIHRDTIDRATERKKRRGGKKIGQK